MKLADRTHLREGVLARVDGPDGFIELDKSGEVRVFGRIGFSELEKAMDLLRTAIARKGR